MVSWISIELALLVWKKRTWAERVGNREYGVLDDRRLGPLGLEEGVLGSKVWKYIIWCLGWQNS